MKEEHITKVQALLSEWNPLGKQVTQLSDLNNYEAEAIDILFYIEKKQHRKADWRNNKRCFKRCF